MKPITALILASVCLSPAALAARLPEATAPSAAAFAGRDWIAKAADNICGLRDLGQVSSPAKVDFQACLDATPEMKKMRSDGIEPSSLEGLRLHAAGVDRVGAACEAVRSAGGYCSVWKAIRHKDGRAVPDVTDLVKAKL